MSDPARTNPRMVFHAPFALNRRATSASGIRPVRMRDAFEALGYDVWEVTGTARERAAAARRVRRAIADGVHFDLCYSESSTMPTSMTESHHLPLHPLLDFALLRSLRRAGTPVGLFYRDIYWAFGGYGQGMDPVKRQAALAAYRWDLLAYRECVDVLYLPSMLMAPHVGVGSLTKKALPPGHDMPVPAPGPDTGVHLFYVGSLNDHYRLPVLFQAVQELSAEQLDVTLTVCTGKAQWEAERATYEPYLCDAISVVHASGEELLPHYAAANVAALFIEPSEYRAFAAPVKLYEYVGQAKPVLASEGTLSGEFVRENGFGWTVPYSLDAAKDQLRRLASDPALIAERRATLLEHRAEHSWRERAATVARDLSRPGSTTDPVAAPAGSVPDIERVVLVGAARSIHTARWANALADRGIEVHLASVHGIEDQAYGPGVHVHLLPSPRGTGYLAGAPALRKLVREVDPQLVNTHYASGYGLLSRTALAGLDVPHLLSVWGSDVYDFPHESPLKRRLLEGNIRAATMLASTSRSMAAETRQYAGGKEIAITPFGIDLARFPVAAGDGAAHDGIVLGTVKTLHEKYGIDTLIRAFALARDELHGTPALRLQVVGGGPDEAKLRQLAAELGVADHVDFTGKVPHEAVPGLMRGFDIYAALSRLESESFGVAILEASACGLPVVVSDVSGPAEVVDDGTTGIIVGRDDPRAAADAIVRLASDAALRQRMGAAGRSHVEELYSWDRSVDDMLAAYRRTLQVAAGKRSHG